MPVNHAAGSAVAIAHTAVLAPNSLIAAIAAETSPQLNREATAARSALEPRTPNLEPRISINSSHHQAIGIPGDGLRVTARSSEDAVIEAVELTPLEPRTSNPEPDFLIGVQWHPERTYETDPASRALFTRFVAAAATWSPKPQSTITG
jgi:putative glutamine amidotransferase